jgi:hypothetical protein
MTRRIVLHHDVLLALLCPPGEPGVAAAARTALRDWIDAGLELVVAGAAWTAILDELRVRGWAVAAIAEAIHALDRLDLVTVEGERAAQLLIADAMDRHELAAADAASVVVGEILGAPVAAVRPAIAAAASEGILIGVAITGSTPATAPPRPSGLPDYRGLGAFLGELRRREAAS